MLRRYCGVWVQVGRGNQTDCGTREKVRISGGRAEPPHSEKTKLADRFLFRQRAEENGRGTFLFGGFCIYIELLP